jgi:hypothetical protein
MSCHLKKLPQPHNTMLIFLLLVPAAVEMLIEAAAGEVADLEHHLTLVEVIHQPSQN